MRLFTEASLSDSMMFEKLNKSSAITSKIPNIIKTGVVLDRSYIEEQYLQCSKTHVSPISDKVLKAFDDGRIKLIYNKTVHLTVAVPFVVLQMGGKPTACIFIADFSSVNKEGTALTIEMKRLYALMEAAYIGLYYFTEPTRFLRNATFMKVNAQIYANMVLRILNREYALSLDKDVYDAVNYAAARFCLESVMGLKSPDLVHSYAASCCNNITNIQLQIVKDAYDTHNISTAEDLVLFIAKQSTKMDKLTFRYFFERWIAAFGTGACLGIDSYPYLFYAINNVLLGAFLVNVSSLSEIVKNAKGINSFYAELTRMVN